MATGNKGASRHPDKPDEHVTKGGVEIDVVQLGDVKVKRARYPSGWRYSKDMGEPRCYDTHVGYTVSGRIHVDLDDGTQLDFEPGSVFMVPAGHDAYVVCSEDCVIVQFDHGESAARRVNVPSVARKAA